MKYRFLTSVFVAAAMCGASAQIASHAPTRVTAPKAQANLSGTKPVARVNGAVLTERDLLREMYAIFPYARQHGGSFPKGMEPEIRKGAMQMIVFEELVYQDAMRRHLSIPPARISAAMKEFRKQFSSDAEYQDVLKQEFQGSEAQLRKGVLRSMLIETHHQRHAATSPSMPTPPAHRSPARRAVPHRRRSARRREADRASAAAASSRRR